MSVRDWLFALGEVELSAADNIGRFEDLMAEGQDETESGFKALFEAAQLVSLAGDAASVWGSATQYDDESALGRTVAIILASFAIVRIDFLARPDAIEARETLADMADKSYQSLGEQSPDILSFCAELAGSAISSISNRAATLSPVVKVETGMPLPSSLLAFDLYGDASRGSELVDRNNHNASMLMPEIFEAVIT